MSDDPPETVPPTAATDERDVSHAREFAELAGAMLDDKLRQFSVSIDEKLRPLIKHIHQEDHDRGTLLRQLATLDASLNFMTVEIQASRKEVAALQQRVDAMADLLRSHEGRISSLERRSDDTTQAAPTPRARK